MCKNLTCVCVYVCGHCKVSAVKHSPLNVMLRFFFILLYVANKTGCRATTKCQQHDLSGTEEGGRSQARQVCTEHRPLSPLLPPTAMRGRLQVLDHIWRPNSSVGE